MSVYRRIASGSALRILDVLVQAFTALWITPQMVHTLGKERYGAWITVITLVGYLDVFDLGLTSAVTRYVSRALGRNDLVAAREAVRSAFTILLCIGAGCLLLVALLCTVAPWVVPGSAKAVPIREIILILGITAAISFPTRVFTGVLEAFVRYECTTAASIARTLLVVTALSWVLRSGGGIMEVVLVVAGGGLFQRALNYFFARRVFPAMHIFPLGTQPAERKALLDYGTKNFMMKLVDLVRFRIDNIVIAKFVGLAPVGVYSIGMSLIRYNNQISDSISGVMMPVFSGSEGAGDRKKIRENFISFTRLLAVVATFIGTLLSLYGGYFIKRWVGSGFDDSYKVVLLLFVPFLLAMAQSPSTYLLYGISRQEKILRLNIVEAILNLTLSLALVFKFGIFGVAAGTGISMLLIKTLLLPRIVCQETEINLWFYYAHALCVPILVTSIPMLTCHILMIHWLQPEYWRLGIAVLAQVAFVAPVIWFALLGATTRQSLQKLITRKPQPKQ